MRYFKIANFSLNDKYIPKNIFGMWPFSDQLEILAKSTLDVIFHCCIKIFLGKFVRDSKISTKVDVETDIVSSSASC